MSLTTCSSSAGMLLSTSTSTTATLLRRSLPSSARCRCRTPLTSVRHESTTRRMTKALRLHPHASFIGTASTIPSKSSHPPPSLAKSVSPVSSVLPHIIHNPPAAAPTPLITPRLFIPQGDPRYSAPAPSAIVTSRPLTNPHPALSTEISAATENEVSSAPETPPEDALKKARLPPALRQPYKKTYHLSEDQIKKIQELRGKNPNVWTKRRLAQEYGCSELFISMVAPTTAERKKEMEGKLEEVKKGWGRIRTFARQERARRRELWGKDL